MSSQLLGETHKGVNQTGVAIAANRLVAVEGFDTQSKNQKIVLACANNTRRLADGITDRSWPANATGYYRRDCILEGTAASPVDTGAGTWGVLAVVGADVYLHPTTPGAWTLTKPAAAGQDLQRIGTVLTVHATLGRIRFSLQQGGTNYLGANDIDDSRLASKPYYDVALPSYGDVYFAPAGGGADVTANDTVTVNGRVYMFTPAGAGLGDVNINMGGAGPWTAAAAAAAFSVAVNADAGGSITAADLGGGIVAIMGRTAVAGTNYAISATSAVGGAITVSAAAMVGSGDATRQGRTARSHLITAQEVAFLATALGTAEIVIGTFGSTTSPRIQFVQAFRPNGGFLDPIALYNGHFDTHQLGGTQWTITYAEPAGGALLQAGDFITYDLQING